MKTTLNTYRAVDTHGKSQLDLIIQVYDGAIAAFRAAAQCYRGDGPSHGHEQLDRAKRFLVHLYTTLDLERGAEVAQNLAKLYAFAIQQTDMVRATKDLVVIDDIVSILDNLRIGWISLREEQARVNKETEDAAVAVGGGDFVVTG